MNISFCTSVCLLACPSLLSVIVHIICRLWTESIGITSVSIWLFFCTFGSKKKKYLKNAPLKRTSLLYAHMYIRSHYPWLETDTNLVVLHLYKFSGFTPKIYVNMMHIVCIMVMEFLGVRPLIFLIYGLAPRNFIKVIHILCT